MEDLQKKVEELLERMAYLEECNRLKDKEILSLQTDVGNLRCACGNVYPGNDYSSPGTNMCTIQTTALTAMDADHTNGDDSGSFFVTRGPRAFIHLEERVRHLEGLVRKVIQIAGIS